MKKYIYYSVISTMLLLTNCSSEKNDWQEAKTQNTVEIFEVFIRNFPQSTFKDSAIYKIEELSFKKVVKSNNLNDYNNFIEQFPKSIFTDSINNKILDLNIINAKNSKDILQIVDYINNYPNNNIIHSFLVSTNKIIEFKSPQTIDDDFVTIIKNSNNSAKMIIQLRVPPKRKISSKLYDFFKTLKNWKMSGAGTLIAHHSIVNGRIAGISHYTSGDKGLSFEKEISNEIIIPLTSKFIQLDQKIILKISDTEFLYSGSNEVKFQRIDKTNDFKLIDGNAYHINLN